MLIVGGEQLLQQAFSLQQLLQIGLMVILHERYFFLYTSSLICVSYFKLLMMKSCIFQMRLGSAFGAFLDPVADKVCRLVF